MRLEFSIFAMFVQRSSKWLANPGYPQVGSSIRSTKVPKKSSRPATLLRQHLRVNI